MYNNDDLIYQPTCIHIHFTLDIFLSQKSWWNNQAPHEQDRKLKAFKHVDGI